jgi:hypothetical protein
MMQLSTSPASSLSNAFLGYFDAVPLQFSTIKFLTDIQSLISRHRIRARNRDCFRFFHNSAEFQRLTPVLFPISPLSTLRIFPVLSFSSFFPGSVPPGQRTSSALHSREDFANIPEQFYSTIGSRRMLGGGAFRQGSPAAAPPQQQETSHGEAQSGTDQRRPVRRA